MKRYVGRRDAQGRLRVNVETLSEGREATRFASYALPPRLDLFNHSPDGFEIGYSGSGPAQLSLAILADHLGDDELAVRLHQEFKRHTIATYDRDFGFNITSEEVAGIIRAISEPHDPGSGDR